MINRLTMSITKKIQWLVNLLYSKPFKKIYKENIIINQFSIFLVK